MNTKKNKNTDSPHFREFFLDQIKDVYWAEKHLSSGLKKMRKAATSPKLAAAFEKHIEETAGQIERLKRVFELLGKTPQAKKCEAMEGLVSEAESMIEDTRKDSYTRDAGLILAAQKAEHYEIASYGTLKVFAEMMGETEIARELGMILKEEVSTDSLLSSGRRGCERNGRGRIMPALRAGKAGASIRLQRFSPAATICGRGKSLPGPFPVAASCRHRRCEGTSNVAGDAPSIFSPR